MSELEELFEVERDQRRIDSMRRDVEKYERLVRRRAALDEQVRLKSANARSSPRGSAQISPAALATYNGRDAINASSSILAGIKHAIEEFSDINISCNYAFYNQYDIYSCKSAYNSILAQTPQAVIIGPTFIHKTQEICSKLDAAN